MVCFPITVLWWDFFIPVSSLKVFGHSIHSERRTTYLEKTIQALQNYTLSYDDYSVSGTSSQHSCGIPLCLFSSIFVHYKKLSEAVGYYLINLELSNNIRWGRWSIRRKRSGECNILLRRSLILANLKYRTHMIFSHNIQAKIFTWPDMSFYAR